jgi:hypothetical protein
MRRRWTIHRLQHRLRMIARRRADLKREVTSLRQEAASVQARLHKSGGPPDAALLASLAAFDVELPLDEVVRIRQAAALEVLEALDFRWSEDELTVRRQFGLPIDRNLWESSLEKAFGSTDVPPTLEEEDPDSE